MPNDSAMDPCWLSQPEGWFIKHISLAPRGPGGHILRISQLHLHFYDSGNRLFPNCCISKQDIYCPGPVNSGYLAASPEKVCASAVLSFVIQTVFQLFCRQRSPLQCWKWLPKQACERSTFQITLNRNATISAGLPLTEYHRVLLYLRSGRCLAGGQRLS